MKTRILTLGADTDDLNENCEDVMYRINNYLQINPEAKILSLYPCLGGEGSYVLTLVVEIPDNALPV